MRRNRILFAFILILLTEFLFRGYFVLRKGASFYRPGDIIYSYYPELETIRRANFDGESIKLLLLGGSVVSDHWSNIGDLLGQNLTEKLNTTVRVYNVALPAHTSLDSYIKYSRLSDIGFDVLLIYHGINEVRANNCPDSRFRSDYSHYSWYEEVNLLRRHKSINYTVLPYAMHYFTVKFRQMLIPEQYVPTHSPKEEWMNYGAKIKTADAFGSNISEIIKIAEKNNTICILSTFAIYDGAPALPNGPRQYSVEIWGIRENVLRGVMAHNDVMKSISMNHEDVIFVDQSELMGNVSAYFIDVCHLSPEGSAAFVENVMMQIPEDILTRLRYSGGRQ